mgnify:CR=1 FL=1
MAQYTAEELITKRAEVSKKMQESLTEKVENRGISVIDFNVTDLNFNFYNFFHEWHFNI